MRASRRLLVTALAVVVAATIALTAAPPDARAASCAGASCTGLDPYASGCGSDRQVAGSAQLVDSADNRVGSLTLYYSPTCKSNWGQAAFDDGNPSNTPPVTIRVVGTQGGGDYDTPPVDYTYTGSGSPVWGNMVYSPGCAYATGTRGDVHGQAVQSGCPAPSPSATASTTCHGASCTGEDPYATGCSAGATIAGSAPLQGGGGTVTLYWSPACQANWAEASFADGNPPTTPAVTVRVVGTRGQGAPYDTPPVDYTTTGSGSPVWGNMVYSPGCAYGVVTRGGETGEAVQQGCPGPAGAPVSSPYPLAAVGESLQVTGGDDLSGTIAQFSDPDPGARPSDFSVTIDWGDGAQADGTVTGSSEQFSVQGEHRYGDPTQPGVATSAGYEPVVTIRDEGGGPDGGGGTATAYASVEVVGRDVPVSEPSDGSQPGVSGGDKAASIALSGFSTLVSGAGCVIGSEIPILDVLVCADAGKNAAETGAAIADPPDRRFRKLFRARTPRLGHVPKRCGHSSGSVCTALYRAEVKYLKAYLKASTLAEDVGVTANRFGGAAKARNRRAENLQRRAERRYFAAWTKAVRARRLAGHALGMLLQRHGLDRRVSARQVALGRLRVLSLAGLSRVRMRALHRDGLASTPAALRALLIRQMSWAPRPGDTTLSAVLGL